MDIENAFNRAITADEVDTQGPPEEELHDVVRQLFVANEIEHTEDHIRLAMISFFAGRLDRASEESLEVPGMMTIALTPKAAGALVNSLLEQLSERQP